MIVNVGDIVLDRGNGIETVIWAIDEAKNAWCDVAFAYNGAEKDYYDGKHASHSHHNKGVLHLTGKTDVELAIKMRAFYMLKHNATDKFNIEDGSYSTERAEKLMRDNHNYIFAAMQADVDYI